MLHRWPTVHGSPIGVSVCTVTNWECNHTVPPTRFVPRLVEFLDYPL